MICKVKFSEKETEMFQMTSYRRFVADDGDISFLANLTEIDGETEIDNAEFIDNRYEHHGFSFWCRDYIRIEFMSDAGFVLDSIDFVAPEE